jgi:hypothetical protein
MTLELCCICKLDKTIMENLKYFQIFLISIRLDIKEEWKGRQEGKKKGAKKSCKAINTKQKDHVKTSVLSD